MSKKEKLTRISKLIPICLTGFDKHATILEISLV
jgi:hypothetical protein